MFKKKGVVFFGMRQFSPILGAHNLFGNDWICYFVNVTILAEVIQNEVRQSPNPHISSFKEGKLPARSHARTKLKIHTRIT